MTRRWNISIWAGFFTVFFGAISYFLFFARIPMTRDFPWLNLIFIALGLVWLGAGVRRAFREPQAFRGRISGPILGVLALALAGLFSFYNFYLSRQLPASASAPRVNAPAPDFSLTDSEGRTVSLDDLLREPVAGRRPSAVLLIFYRGYW
jgi:hypothetical protein